MASLCYRKEKQSTTPLYQAKTTHYGKKAIIPLYIGEFRAFPIFEILFRPQSLIVPQQSCWDKFRTQIVHISYPVVGHRGNSYSSIREVHTLNNALANRVIALYSHCFVAERCAMPGGKWVALTSSVYLQIPAQTFSPLGPFMGFRATLICPKYQIAHTASPRDVINGW
jgi:hypothetical protein